MSGYRSFIRDVLVATAVIVGLYALARGVRLQPAAVPGHLLVVGFDWLESVFGASGRHYDVVFGVYLLGLGVVGAAVATIGRRWVNGGPWYRLPVAGALSVIGAVSLSFCALLIYRAGQGAPVVTTAVTGLVFLAVAGWLAGLFTSDRAAIR